MRLALAASLALALGIASAAQAQVKLEIKDREGTLTTRSTAKTHQVLTIAGMDIETSSSIATTTTSSVGKPEADGTVRVKETISDVKANLALPGDMKVSFDSDKPDAKSDNADLQGLIDLWRSMKGVTFTVVVGPDHKVRDVEGNFDAIIAKAQGQFADAAKERLSKEAMKREAAEGRDVLPDKPVNKGDRWQRTRVLHIGAG